MRALKILGGVIAAIAVVAALLLVVGMPLGFLTSTIQDRVQRETGYHLTIAGSTRIELWPSLNVSMSDLTLERPGDGDAATRLTAASIRADLTLGGLWSGRPEITELVIDRPVITVPLQRERRPAPKIVASAKRSMAVDTAGSSVPKIERITITDGTVTFSNARDQVESRVEGISARTVIGIDRHVSVAGNARISGHALAYDVKASLPDLPMERQNIPFELSLDLPGLLQAPLSSKAEVRLNGSLVMINGLSGAIGDGAFDGWASVDFASKPLVKLDLDFRRLDIATTSAPAAPERSSPAWSDDTIDLAGLNYVDAQIRLSAAEFNIGQAHFTPAAIEGSLTRGVLKGVISNLGAYGGQANCAIDIDVSRDAPVYALHSELTGVRALPLLRSAAGFDKLDGKLQARIDVRSTGQSQHAIMSNLNGTVLANFQDGAIRSLNVAQMIRSLTSGTLSGWQESREQATDLTQLSASFRIEKGQATTADLNLVGPLVKMTGTGTIDLGAKMLALRVEPKLVMTTEGQGRATDPVGFGIPVAIDGPWANPRIYPDVAGILDNPDAAYAKLKEMGAGLFAPGGVGNGSPGNTPDSADPADTLGGKLGETLGNLLQQGLSAGRPRSAPPPSSPNDPSAPAQAQPSQGGRPMNDVLRQLFGR